MVSQIGNVGPSLGQGYIIDSFMVVVFGGADDPESTSSAFADWGRVVAGAVLIEPGPLDGPTLERLADDMFDLDIMAEWLNDYTWSHQFFTPDDYSQQLAYMRHPAGKVIDPHVHNPVSRNVHFTQEVLLIKSGRVRVDFYDEDQRYLESRVLNAGDVILLAFGGRPLGLGNDGDLQQPREDVLALRIGVDLLHLLLHIGHVDQVVVQRVQRGGRR